MTAETTPRNPAHDCRPGDRDRRADLADRHLDRSVRGLVADHAQRAADLLDPELHLLQLALDAQRVRDRGGLVHQAQQYRLLGSPRDQSCVQVHELRRDVLPGHRLRGHGPEPFQRAERRLERRCRNAE
jgi:hypothetical protein